MTYGRRIWRTCEARSAELNHYYTSGFPLCLLSPGGQLEFEARALPFMQCTHNTGLTDSPTFIDRTFEQLGGHISRSSYRRSKYREAVYETLSSSDTFILLFCRLNILYEFLRNMSIPLLCTMSGSLLSLPYELREQILTSLLCKSGSIKLQHTTDSKTAITPPIAQVCRLLREEAVRVFYKVNTFTLTIDPEAVS